MGVQGGVGICSPARSDQKGWVCRTAVAPSQESSPCLLPPVILDILEVRQKPILMT